MTANPRTLYELSRFDPLNADPADIAVAVKTDRKLHLRQGDVVLRLALDSDDKSRAFDERFVLSITRDTGTANLAGSLKETEHVLSAAVAAGDRERFRAVQARARKAREEAESEQLRLLTPEAGAALHDVGRAGVRRAVVEVVTVDADGAAGAQAGLTSRRRRRNACH